MQIIAPTHGKERKRKEWKEKAREGKERKV
jgi:hypothetical protein